MMSDNPNPNPSGEQPAEANAGKVEGLAKKSLKLIYVYAIATGAVLTMMGYWDTVFISYCGPATFVAFALMTVLILPIAFVYCELTPMFPQAGAEIIYNTVGLNKHIGFFSSWMIMAAWVSCAPACTMCLIQWFFRIFGLTQADVPITVYMVICIILVGIYMILSLADIQIAGKIQVFMLFAALIGVAITCVLLLFSGHWSVKNYTPFFQSVNGNGGFGGWLIGLGLIITPYFGFETVPQMVEEGDFPIKNASKAILGSVVTCGVIYTIFFGIIAGLGPWADIVKLVDGQATVEFLTITAMDGFGGGFWVVWTLIFGFCGVFCTTATSLLGFWLSTVRLMYAMGRLNFLPEAFARVNKRHQPILPNVLLFVISILLILSMNAATFMNDFFNLMAFGCAVAYFVTCISSIRIKMKYNWQSPYVLKGGMGMRVLAAVIALFIAVLTTLGQGVGSWRSFAIYMGIGIVLWLWMVFAKWKRSKVVIETPQGPIEY